MLTHTKISHPNKLPQKQFLKEIFLNKIKFKFQKFKLF